MNVEIVHVPDCPNVALLAQRLDEAFGPGGLDVTCRVVADLDTATAVGMTGSPTLLVDGVDPFASPGLAPSVSCRLYPDENGRAAGAPSTDALRRALGRGLGGGSPATNSDQPESCCASPATGAAVLRTARRRTAPTDPVEHAVHRAILRAFAATGRAPDPAGLDAQALRSLHNADVIRLGEDGRIRVTYPFSAAPTRHRVRLASGVEVHAMCAIDALGLPAMLATDAVISTSDPVTGDPITVTVVAGRSVWDPDGAVVLVGACGAGPSADTCCDYLNMFTTRENAASWTRTHQTRYVAGEILNRVDAELLGRQIFGDLLA